MRQRILHLTRADFIWQTFRAGGNGGQNQNKRDSAVRCIHEPSGARGESREHRTQWKNKQAAFRRCAESPEFQRWIKVEHARTVGSIESAVDYAMRPENLLIEYGPFNDEGRS